MIAPRLRIRLPSAPKDGTPSQRQWFAAVTNWINAVVDDTQAPVAETQDKVTRRSLQIDMVDNTPDLEKPLSQAAQARFTAIQESLSRLTASTSVTVIRDWDVAATGAAPTTAKSGMYFRATTAGTVGAVPLNIGDVVLFYLDNTGALQWIIVDSPAERAAAYTPADWDATTGVARIENKPTLFGLSSLLTGLAAGTNVAIAATDSLIIALAKLQAQLTTNAANIAANTALIAPVSKRLGSSWYQSSLYYDPAYPNATSQTNISVGAGNQFYVPILVLESVTINQLAVNVTGAAAAGGLLQMGIYSSAADNSGPNAALFTSSQIASTSTGVKSESCSVVLTAGIYWVSYLAITAAATITTQLIPRQITGRAAITTAAPAALAATSVTSMPTNAQAGLITSTTVPMVCFRAA